MESWSYVSGGKGFVSDESVSFDAIEARAKNGSLNWEFKNPFSFGPNFVSPGHNDNQGFGIPEMMRKSVSSSSKVDSGILFNPISPSQNAFSEGESSLKISSSVVESNSRDSGLIDLKLGRFGGGDQREANPNPNPNPNINPNLGSAESSHTQTHITPAKRMRVGGFGSQTPLCQVHGCKKNLSSSKDYHKRHKVCEIHSKTSKVIVNGLEQRFCQQCSRFHLLPEFDDGKRSCRKRLAGHNQRRRKPHVGIHSRAGRLFPSYDYATQGTAVSGSKGTTTAPSSYISQDIGPSSIAYLQKYGANNWAGHIKLEDETYHYPQSTISFTDGKMHSRSLYPSGFQKYYPPLQESGPNPSIQSKSSNDNSNQYSHNSGLSSFTQRSFFRSNSIGDEDFTMFDSVSTVEGLSGIPPDTGRALSLLSSQSQNSSSFPSPFHMPHPLLIPGRQNDHYNVTQLSVNPQASRNGVSNNCQSSGMSSVEEAHLDPILISDGSNAATTFGIDGLFQGSEYGNSRERMCSEDGPTIDLLQLSSQLQRVEHQRQGLRVEPEDDTFFGLRIS